VGQALAGRAEDGEGGRRLWPVHRKVGMWSCGSTTRRSYLLLLYPLLPLITLAP
jgi:hypothetical protein